MDTGLGSLGWRAPTKLRTVFSVLSLKRLFLIYSIPAVAAICMLSVLGVMERPDLFFLDQAFLWRGTQEPAREVAIVAISQRDFERGAPRWPWPRSLMARLADQVSRHRPAVVVMDILYSERSNSEALITRERFSEVQPFLYQGMSGVPLEIQTKDGTKSIGPGTEGFDQFVAEARPGREQDLELAAAVQRAVDGGVKVMLAAQTINGYGVTGLVEPYAELDAASGGSIGLVGVMPAADRVLRRYVPYGQDKDGSFIYGLAVVAVAESMGLNLPSSPDLGGDFAIGDNFAVEVADGQFSVNFPGPAGTHTTPEARDVLRRERDSSSELKGKIVFIGVTDPSVEDVLPKSFSGTNRMAGVEFHAAAAGTLLRGSFIDATPRYQVLMLVVFLGLGAIALGRVVSPLPVLGGAAAVLAGIFGAWIGSFVWAGYFLPITALLAAWFGGYAISLADRVGVEQYEKQQARSMLSRYLSPGIVKEMLKNPNSAR